MTTISFREKNMIMIAGVAILYLIAGLSYKRQMTNWDIAKRGYANACKKYDEERALIANRKQWEQTFNELRELLPTVSDKADITTANKQQEVRAMATKHGLSIINMTAGKETEVGDVYELELNTEWTGSLEGLIKFLHNLGEGGAKFDMRQLAVRAVPQQQGMLKGSFKLFCAYMRGEEIATENLLPGKNRAEPSQKADVSTRPEPDPTTKLHPKKQASASATTSAGTPTQKK
jgi:hypothetical protein